MAIRPGSLADQMACLLAQIKRRRCETPSSARREGLLGPDQEIFLEEAVLAFVRFQQCEARGEVESACEALDDVMAYLDLIRLSEEIGREDQEGWRSGDSCDS